MRALIVLSIASVSFGCLELDINRFAGKDAAAPSSAVCQVHATWENRILVTADTVNQGAPLKGIAGRVYLFGSEIGHPLAGDGKLLVDLYDAVHVGPDGQPRWLERFDFDPDSLKLLLRKDFIGSGYTLFLPWSTYRPDITRVQLKVCYMPEKGAPLHAPVSNVTLRHDAVSQN